MDVVIEYAKPGRAVNANDRLHWAAKRRLLQPWILATTAAYRQAGSPQWDRAAIRISFPVADRRRRDPSNLMPTQKAIIDALVRAGAFPDDCPQVLDEYMPTVHLGDTVRITIECAEHPR